MPILRLNAPADVVADYFHFFVSRRADILQSDQPHAESGVAQRGEIATKHVL
jgi:hypothetical protein